MRCEIKFFKYLCIGFLSIAIVSGSAVGCEVQSIRFDSLLKKIDDSLQAENPAQIRILIGARDAIIRVSAFNSATNRHEDIHEGQLKVAQTHPNYCEALIAGANVSISLAAGVTNWHVFEALRNIDFLKGDMNNLPTEGMLAPGTYSIVQNESRQSVLDRMVSLQENILAEMWSKRQTGLPLTNKSEALILASIIEKETSVSNEGPRIASVFVNRLIRGMPLQTDPTVIYGITKGEGVLGRGLRRSELDSETPWNTYKIRGLPPTPIANPGRPAIEAALNPEATEYIFFVADGTGGHAFAATLAEHNRNVAAWRKIAAQVSNTSAVAQSCTSEPTRCSLQELCSRATYSMSTQSKETKIWWRSDLKSKPYVKDAERRGVSCGVVDQREIERERQEKIERARQQKLADQRQIVKDIQLHLNKHGCQAGAPDGISGRKTQAAIKRFLSAKKITRTPSDKELRSILMKTSGTICVKKVQNPPKKLATTPPQKPKKSAEDSLLCALTAGAAVATGGSSLLFFSPGCF